MSLLVTEYTRRVACGSTTRVSWHYPPTAAIGTKGAHRSHAERRFRLAGDPQEDEGQV